MKIVKEILTKYFILAISKDNDDLYYVSWDHDGLTNPYISKPVLDFNTANDMFNKKLLELEGH